MQVHRPDFAALIAALEANLPPEPKRAPLVTPPRPPSRSFAQQAKDLAEDDRITHALLAPPMKLVFKEPAYIPDFARPAEVAVEVDLAGGESIFATAAPAGATHMQIKDCLGGPVAHGTYYYKAGDYHADYFHSGEIGRGGNASGRSNDDLHDTERFVSLAPVAGAVQAEEVPSAEDLLNASMHIRSDKWCQLVIEHGMTPGDGFDTMPPHRRAEFIRRCNELR